jgi:outer membrane protein insertion porin family
LGKVRFVALLSAALALFAGDVAAQRRPQPPTPQQRRIDEAPIRPARPEQQRVTPLPQSGIADLVQVEGNQRIEADTIRSYMQLDASNPYEAAAVDRSLKALFATGLFADVTIRRQGDRIVVAVVENPIINRVAFEGNKRVSDKNLEQEVQLRARVVYTRARVQADVQRVIQVYRRGGRFSATVEPKVIQLAQNRVDLIFEIDEGPVTGIRRINFIGNKKFDDERLRRAIATKESRWYRFFSSDDTYDPDRLTLDRELLRKFYLGRGHADFRVVSAVAELTPDQADFFVTFTVEEGELYKFGKVEIASELKNLDPARLRLQLKTLENEVYNAELIDKTIEDLTFEVGRLGYAFVDIKPRVRRDREARTIAITYEINEGPRVYVERIDITGNVRTLDSVIRREFRLAEGDAFNTAKLRRSRQRIRALGFFDKVEVTQARGSTPDRTVVNVDVQERSTGELSFGAGFSSTETIIGDIGLRERNLLGRGQDLRLDLSASPRRQQIDLSFTEPYLLGQNLAGGIDLFQRRRDLQDRSGYNEIARGASLRTGFPLTEEIGFSIRYFVRQDRILDVNALASRFVQAAAGGSITSGVGYAFGYDTRDDRFEPTSGMVARFGQDIAGLGGSLHYIRSNVSYSYFYPLGEEWVASFAMQGGHITGVLGDNVNINNRFFVGGDNFRGFRLGGIGPRDIQTADALGANVYGVGTVELKFPLGLPQELGLFGRTFTDFGTATSLDEVGGGIFDSKSLRVSLGVGISWRSPFGPIRVDLSRPVLKESLDEPETFRFSFGTRF